MTLPAAAPPLADGIAIRVAVADESGEPLRDVHVLALYPNNTYLEARTDAFGHADFMLHSALPMTVLCAAAGFQARVVREQEPDGALELRMAPLSGGGSWIVANQTDTCRALKGG